MSDASSTLYLIDGHAQFFRAYHAIRTGMTSPVTHEPTNLVYGFFGMLIKLLREQKPSHLAVVIDVSGDTESFRSRIYPEYKMNRDPAPEDFHPQVERCLQVLDAMRMPVYGMEGVEADDVIATIARRIVQERDDVRVRIVSRDKDLTQLIDDRIELYDPYKDELVTPDTLFKTEGVEPKHVVDVLALMGDNVDNVPGVVGIGPKTAGKLILEYGDLDALLENIDEIKGKRRENIEAAREQLPISRELVMLKDDCDVDFDLASASAERFTLAAPDVIALFRELGFNRPIDELKTLGDRGGGGRRGKKADDGQAGLFDRVDDEDGPRDGAPPGLETAVTLVRTTDELDAAVDAVRAAGVCAIDVETNGLRTRQARLCGVSLAVETGRAWYIPVRSPKPDSHLDLDAVRAALGPILADESIGKVGHNLKFDMLVLRHEGMPLAGIAFDTMIASYVIDATRSSHRLDVLVLAGLGLTSIDLGTLLGRGKSARTFDEVPLDEAARYAGEDVDAALRLRAVYAPILKKERLETLFNELETPLVDVLAEMEWNGIIVDPDELDRQRDALAARIDGLRDAIADAAPHPFNPDSPKQLAGALFNAADDEPPGLGLKPIKRGKTGPSTDQEVLEKLDADLTIATPLPSLVLEYRQLTKLVNTYLESLKHDINPETKRIHASFNQTVAATGRLSSSDPNLQNIPIRTEIGREIRRAFVAPDGCVLITADYSQIELRILAHLSEDPALIEAFERGEDIHTAVAAEVFGVAPADVTSTERNSAKMVNFGIIYGITPYGLARRLGPDTPVTEAAEIIDRYKLRFSRIGAFLDACVDEAFSRGYVETMMGRRRAIPQVYSDNRQQRALGERTAINTVVQGSAADLIKAAMVDLHAAAPEAFPDLRMVLQIHDELVFECPEGEASGAAAFVRERMEGAMSLRVPLVAEAAWSREWVDAK